MKTDKIHDIVAPVVEGLGYQLWGLEHLQQGKHSLLRVYIETEQGITLDDCGKVSHQLSAVLDVEEPIHGEYSLEVSSPGLDRPLFTEQQFQQSIGEMVQVRMRVVVNGQRKFKGLLQAVSEGMLIVLVDQQAQHLPLTDVDKANILFTDGF